MMRLILLSGLLRVVLQELNLDTTLGESKKEKITRDVHRAFVSIGQELEGRETKTA